MEILELNIRNKKNHWMDLMKISLERENELEDKSIESNQSERKREERLERKK